MTKKGPCLTLYMRSYCRKGSIYLAIIEVRTDKYKEQIVTEAIYRGATMLEKSRYFLGNK